MVYLYQKYQVVLGNKKGGYKSMKKDAFENMSMVILMLAQYRRTSTW